MAMKVFWHQIMNKKMERNAHTHAHIHTHTHTRVEYNEHQKGIFMKRRRREKMIHGRTYVYEWTMAARQFYVWKKFNESNNNNSREEEGEKQQKHTHKHRSKWMLFPYADIFI